MTDTKFLWDRLLETVFLLLGLATFNTAIALGWPYFVFSYFSEDRQLANELNLLLRYSHWIGQIAFGLIIYYKLRPIRIAAPIGLLSIVIPVFGALFYLMTSAITQTHNDR